ncbi:MAG: O-antigen ligase family protein, partial [Planctomycetia bacterium]
SRVVAIGMILGWVGRGLGNWNFRAAGPQVFALVGFLGWAVVSAGFAPDQKLAWQFIESFGKIVLPFVIGLTLINNKRDLTWLAWTIVLSQGYVAYEMNLSYYNGYNRVLMEGFARLDNNSVAISMVTCIGTAFFLALSEKNIAAKIVAAAAAMLMTHVVLFSFSRGGMLALIFTATAAFGIIKKRPQHYLVFLLAVLFAIRLAGPEVRERFMSVFADPQERDVAAQSRLELWTDCIDAMFKSPVVGCGPDHWPKEAMNYGWSEGKEGHSLWLQTGAEMGMPGLLLLFLFYATCVGRLLPLTFERTHDRDGRPIDPTLQHFARMVISSLAGFALASQFVSLERLEIPYYVALVGAGALKLASAGGTARPEPLVR